MAVQRIWLDWNHHCLPQAASWLLEHADTQDTRINDLSGFLCILPGSRAGRILLGELIAQSRDRNQSVIPPRIITPGYKVDELFRAAKPVAMKNESLFAWATAIQTTSAETLKPILPQKPENFDVVGRMNLARQLMAVHETLSGGRMTFFDVAEKAQHLTISAEMDRWNALSVLHEKYRDILNRAGLQDQHDRTEDILCRIENGSILLPSQRLVLVGVDLNRVQQTIVHAFDSNATALIHAPESLKERFDETGCVIPELWENAHIDIDEELIECHDTPADQADAVINAIASFEGRYSADEITVGLGDRSPGVSIVLHASWTGLSIHDTTGRPAMRSPPARFLAAVADWLEDQRFATFTALLRHADVEQWVNKHVGPPNSNGKNSQEIERVYKDWLSLLDRYFQDHLHERFTGDWLGDEDLQTQLKYIYGKVCELLSPLSSVDEQRSLNEWVQPILAVLASIYEGSGEDIKSCELTNDVLREWNSGHPILQTKCNAVTAMRLLEIELSLQFVATSPGDEDIEMLGWLDVHLDTSPALILAGFNDGGVPETVLGDAFLPDSLRTQLGLANNVRRYARDAYLFQAICKSREYLRVILGKTSVNGDPLTPSRLLFACLPEELPKRILPMTQNGDAKTSRVPHGLLASSAKSSFEVPQLPHDITIPQSMNVTDFKKYLDCPYRYALERLVGLKATQISYAEMDPILFGIIAHHILSEFGANKSLRNSTDAKRIEAFLESRLTEKCEQKFGASPSPAIRVQIAQLMERFRVFAQYQAELCEQGWVIQECEYAIKGTVKLECPNGDPMPVHAKIDRIDYNKKLKTWRIIDYKTGDSAKSPSGVHNKKQTHPVFGDIEWSDLQLPLYDYLARRSKLRVAGSVELGYILLPGNASEVGFDAAQWSDEELQDAITLTQEVVQAIRDRRFDINPSYESRFDSFAHICHAHALKDNDEGEGEE